MPFAHARISGPLDRDGIALFLDESLIPVRLACVAPSGWPIVVSLWFARRGDELVCATQRSSSLVRALEHEPRCAFEVAGERPPYRGGRGRARVTIEPDEGLATLAELVSRYLGGTEGSFARWLLGRTSPEVVLRLDPVEISSWDYSRRMRS
jgi:nitroimidazol reductase NimA-like FMN-containing flavoprotein (pyridoxamine 5'-phosphate oxidase superfamily)